MKACLLPPPPLLGRVDGAVRYIYYSNGKSWADSQDLCRQKHTDLAYVKTESDSSRVAKLINTSDIHNIAWIGLFNDAWMWSDGRETSFRYWLIGDQQGNCAAAAGAQQGRWLKLDCDMKTTFVCQGGEFLERLLKSLFFKVARPNQTCSVL